MVQIQRHTQMLLIFSLLCSFSLATGSEENKEEVNNSIGKGEIFYLQNVLTKFAQNGCLKCHARGYIRPNISYEPMLRRLAIGDSDENNVLIYKIGNIRSFSPEIPNHPGGQRCATIDAEPCKTVRQWWNIEFGIVRDDK
jgi:hypothetical protein|tara:strand:+ start:582 stop:1001 length:420 start_codon:yes stop_codon:yes gene_type:complete